MNAKQARLLSDPTTAKQYSLIMQGIDERVKESKNYVEMPFIVANEILAHLLREGFSITEVEEDGATVITW